jgi:VanZ family protein
LRVVETPRSHLWRLVALGLPLALVALAAMLPPDLVPQFRWPTGAPISDKVLHVLGFAALGCVFGLAIEVAQAWAGLGRQGDPQDALANLLGLVVAFVVIGCWRALWSLQPSPPPAAQP